MLALLVWDRSDGLLNGISAEHRGGRGYPPLCMLKAQLLTQRYNLSDPALEDAMTDRLSFCRICGFPVDAETPDETSFAWFRANLQEVLFRLQDACRSGSKVGTALPSCLTSAKFTESSED